MSTPIATPRAGQLEFATLKLPDARPMWPLNACACILDRTDAEIISMIEDGRLQYAWNIATRRADRAEWRIWRGSIHAYAAGEITMQGPFKVLAGLFPHSRETLRTPELERLLSCSPRHVQRLCDDGTLTTHGDRPEPIGPNSFRRVTRASIEAFLRNRQSGATL